MVRIAWDSLEGHQHWVPVQLHGEPVPVEIDGMRHYPDRSDQAPPPPR